MLLQIFSEYKWNLREIPLQCNYPDYWRYLGFHIHQNVETENKFTDLQTYKEANNIILAKWK